MAITHVEEEKGVAEVGPELFAQRVDTPLSRTVRRFRRHKLAMAGVAFIVILGIMAVAAPLITPDPIKPNLPQTLEPPSSEHWLGTDPLGRDVWARVVYAIRVSLSVGLVAVGISLVISLLLGSVSGYYSGAADMIIMRITDVIMCVPGLIIIITVVSMIGPSIYNIMIVIGVLGWPGYTRLLRGQILSVRERDFVMAARATGVQDLRIMFVHVLPNSTAPLLVAATFGIAGAILTEAGLSFLGLGVMPPTPSWGNMLNGARSLTILQRSTWYWIPPGIAILLTVLAINFIGDGLRDALDPHMTMD